VNYYWTGAYGHKLAHQGMAGPQGNGKGLPRRLYGFTPHHAQLVNENVHVVGHFGVCIWKSSGASEGERPLQVAGTRVDAIGCKFLCNGTIGAFITKGASCTFTDCCLQRNRSSGCEVRDRQSSLLATNSIFCDNGRVGVYTHSAAHTELVKCRLHGNQAFEVLCGGREGADIGGGTTIYCSGCDFTGKMLARHAARIFKAAPVEEEEDRSNAWPQADVL
jgi:hypothetical protein